MKRSLNALMAMAVGMAGLAVAPRAEAVGPSADITITVTIAHLAVSVNTGSVGFGTVRLDTDTVSPEVQKVKNEGNVAETYTLEVDDEDYGLQAGLTKTAAGADTYVLQALFTSAARTIAPASADFGADPARDDDVVKANPAATAASATSFGLAVEADNGAAVPQAEERNLYFKYHAPTSDSKTGGGLDHIKVVIAATAA